MPLRSIETKEQRQQRFLERDLERERRKQGLSSLPGQAAWMAGLMAPTSGITDYFGLYPEAPTGEGVTGEKLPSFAENIQNKEYLDALYQGLGITGDLALGAGAFYPPLLGVGAGMKVASGVGKASKAAKGALHSRYKTAPYFSGDNIVTNPDVLQLDLPKEYGTTIQAKYAETADGKFIISPDKMESTFSEFVKDMRPLSINQAEHFGKDIIGKTEFDSLEEARTALIDYVLRDEGWFGKGWDKTEQKHLTKVYDWLRKERGMTVRPPETGIVDEYNAFIPFTKTKRGEKTQYQKNIEEDSQEILEVDLGGGHSIKGPQEEIDNFFAKEPFDPEEQRLMDEAFERHEKKKDQETLDLLREEVADITKPEIEATVDELLDWQKPLTEQQPVVQEKIKNLIGEDFFNQAVADGYTGEEVYNRFNDAILRDDLAQYGLEFLEPSLSTEKLGAGAYLNEAGIKGIVYNPRSVEVFDPLKYKKIDPAAGLPKSLQPPKPPIGLTNKKITARALISRKISPDFYGKDELMAAVGSVAKKNQGEALPPWIYRHKSDAPGGIRDFDGIQELFYEADSTWAARLDEAHNTPGGDANELVSEWLRDDDLIPSQVDEVYEWNRIVEDQERTIDLLESNGYTPKGLTDEEVDMALKKISENQETVEVEVFDFFDDDTPPFNSGGPVTQPLYNDRRYII